MSQEPPCPVSWKSMSGTQRARICGLCQARVVDVRGLDRRRTQSLLGEAPPLSVREDERLLLAERCEFAELAHCHKRRWLRRATIVIGSAVAGVVLSAVVVFGPAGVANLINQEPVRAWSVPPEREHRCLFYFPGKPRSTDAHLVEDARCCAFLHTLARHRPEDGDTMELHHLPPRDLIACMGRIQGRDWVSQCYR